MIPIGLLEGSLNFPSLANPASTWRVVITDLNEGGDHDSSPHGMGLDEAIEWMQKWFFERSYGVSSVEDIDLYWSPVQEHPSTSKRHIDAMCQNEGTAPHDEFGNLLATLWED